MEKLSVLRDTGCSTVFVRSKLVSDNQKTGRAKVITRTDGTRITCGEVVIDVKTSYISGKVHALCLDSPFADVINGNNVIIVVHKDAGDRPKVKKLEKVNYDACVAVQARSVAKKEEKSKQNLDETSSTNAKVEGIWFSREKYIEYQERADS